MHGKSGSRDNARTESLVTAARGPTPVAAGETDQQLLERVEQESPQPGGRRAPEPGGRYAPPELGCSLDRDEVLRTVAETMVETLPAPVCLVILFGDDEAPTFQVQAAYAPGIHAMEAATSLTPHSLVGRAIASGRAAWTEDGAEPPRLVPRDAGARLPIRSGIAAPLSVDGEVTGVLVAYHSTPRAYGPREAELLATLAARAGAALRNCALYERQREIADTLQRSFAPSLPGTIAGVEVGHTCLPHTGQAGGDFYDLAPLPDGRLAILVGDVSGSGVRAAVHTAMGKYMARAFAFEAHPPGVVLRQLNDAMCAHGTGDCFLTLFAGELHPGGRLRYANGAHPSPILRRARGSLSLLGTTGTVVGLLPEQQYTERQVQLEPGDTLLLYTDGVIEAARRGELFGPARLQAVLRQWNGGHPQELVDHLLDAVRRFTGGHLADDAAALALRFG